MWYEIVSERSGPVTVVKSPADTVKLLKRYERKRQEHFIALTLRGDHSVERVRLVTIGTANKTLVHPREVFAGAIRDNATAIIIAHNHPSGNLDPSSEDREVTKRIVEAGNILGIPVLDHIIFSAGAYKSFVEAGCMPHC